MKPPWVFSIKYLQIDEINIHIVLGDVEPYIVKLVEAQKPSSILNGYFIEITI